MEVLDQLHIAIYLILAVAFQVCMFLELKGKKPPAAFAFFIIFATVMEALVAHVYLTGKSGPSSILSVGAMVIALALTGLAFVISRMPLGK
jgi:1,4-dihydroxy-2-naphthoate octaprenyltransferase